MQIRHLRIENFRGFERSLIKPSGHVVVVGEPRSGRSDLAEAILRVLSPDATRLTPGDDLDFFNGDRDATVEIEVVLGDLGPDLEQRFFDQLEFWDLSSAELVPEVDDPQTLDVGTLEAVVRLCYRLDWEEHAEQGRHWVDYPKTSDPDAQLFNRIRRRDHEALPFFAGHAGSRPLSLAARARLRGLISGAAGDDFAPALDELSEGIFQLAGGLVSAGQVKSALNDVLGALRLPLNLGDVDVQDVFRFVPEGGLLSGILRSLAPTLKLPNGPGYLPLSRHGSTAQALLSATEMAASAGVTGIVVIDDFGEHLDGDGARHIAATIRNQARQVWLTTRRSPVIEAFRPTEIIRLCFDSSGKRSVYQGRDPETKSERQAHRHFSLQVLPAVTASAVVLLEGPHDRLSLHTLSERLFRDDGVPLPAARRVALADAGTAEGSGGASALGRLANWMQQLGMFVVSVIDGDRGQQAEEELSALVQISDAVVRLPDGVAIELALLDGLSEADIRFSLQNLDAELPADLDQQSGPDLTRSARTILKQRGGLHVQFLEALPQGHQPSLATRLLDIATRAAADKQTGLIQL